MISFSCDNCGKKFKVSSDKGGKTAKCPGCGHILQIPLAGGTPQAFRTDGAASSHASHRPPPHHRSHTAAQNRSSQAGRQRANMIFLGVILLIGFAMPLIQFNPFTQERNAEFINITILSAEHAPAQIIVLFLAPGIAGMGLLILQAFTKHPVRGLVVLFLALMPLLIALTDSQTIVMLNVFQKHIPAKAALTMLVVFLGLFVAPVALLAGMRSRGYRPASQVAYWFGAVGAGAWFIFLAAPILPSEAGSIFLMLPIKLMGQSGAGGVSMGLLVTMVCTSISAVLCIINKPASDPRKALSQAGLAFWTLVIGFVVFMLCVSGQFIKNFPTFINSMKSLCWFMGMFLLFPAGITDLIVGRAHHHKHKTPETVHPHTDGPDIPRRVI